MKRPINNLCIALMMVLCSLAYAKSGLLFHITESGAAASVDVILCLNGKGPLSCQNYHVAAQDLVISATANHYYPAAGIKVLTPGYKATGCTPYSNGYCLFGVSSQTPTTILLNGNTQTVGGTITGLVGSVSLQNNGGDTFTQSSDGSFTFASPVAEGASYNVTVFSQPATQTCTASNTTGTMDGSNVTNVQVTCSTNSYTVGGTITGLVGSVSLQNNDGDTLTQSSEDSFTFATSVAEGASYHVTVSSQPATQTCTASNTTGTMGSSNVTNVQVDCATNTTTLSVSATGTIPVNTDSGSITVSNTGTNPATKVSVTLPSGWTGVTQDASNCESISIGDSCTITFTTTTPYVAQGAIPVTGGNISNAPTTALAFTVSGYLVWEVDVGNVVQVIDTSDLSTSEVWGSYITTGAQSLTDGVSNTSTINGTSGIGTSAAVSCYNSIHGGASAGTWYLPAICQMGGPGQGAGCSSGLANIDTNLVQLGFISFPGAYWSSTESSADSQFSAWVQNFSSGGGSFQHYGDKNAGGIMNNYVRCARGLTY